MLTVNQEFLAHDFMIQVISQNNIVGVTKLVLVGFVKSLKRFTTHVKILNIPVMLKLLMESKLKSVTSRVALDLFSMIEKWIVIQSNVILKLKNGRALNT